MKLFLSVIAVLIAGCAHQPLVAPNPGAVQGGLSRVQASASTAEQQRQEALRLNQEARATQARIDNKNVVIDAYKKWKLLHP